MHLVDVATRMQLAATGQVAACVPFEYKKKQKMTLYKGEAALATRRAVASTLTHSLITALQRPRRVDDKPDFAPMQQLFDAGIRRNPITGTAVFNPDNAKPSLLAAYWKADGSIADTIDTKQMGQTDKALDELQMRLHEHAAQITEKKQLRQAGALAKRPRSSSPAASSNDEGTDTGRPRKRPMRPMTDDDASTTSVLQFSGGDDTVELDMPQALPSSPQPPPAPPPSPPPSPPTLSPPPSPPPSPPTLSPPPSPPPSSQPAALDGAPVAPKARRVIRMRDVEDTSTMAISFSGDAPMDVTDGVRIDAVNDDGHQSSRGIVKHRPSRSIVKRDKRPAAAIHSATKETRQLQFVDMAATELMCPIRHELPIEPVVAEDGRIYEKAAIEGWLSRKQKSPMTNLAMGTHLTPVICVKNAISNLVCSGALDSDKAMEWQQKDRLERMHRAAEGGDAKAMFTLRLWYASGEWQQNMTNMDVGRLNRAAEAGDANAMFKLGLWYFKRGVRLKSGIRRTGEDLLWTAYVYDSDCACYILGCLELYGLGSSGVQLKWREYDVQQNAIQAECCFNQIPACNVKYNRWQAAHYFFWIPSCKFKQLRVELKQEVAAWLRAEDAERDAMQSQLP